MLSASTKKVACSSTGRLRWSRRPRSSPSAILTPLRRISTTASEPPPRFFASLPSSAAAAATATTTAGAGLLWLSSSLRDRFEEAETARAVGDGAGPSSDPPPVALGSVSSSDVHFVDLDDVWVLRRVVDDDEDGGEGSEWFDRSAVLAIERPTTDENDFELVPPEADEYVHPLLATSG